MRVLLNVTLPADARLLGGTRRFVGGYLEGLGVDPADAGDIVLAIDEACVNVIRHAYPEPSSTPLGGDEPFLRLTAELDPESVLVEVEDEGIGFRANATSMALPPPESLNGRGLGLMRELMTTVEVDRAADHPGTLVRMRKELTRSRPRMP